MAVARCTNSIDVPTICMSGVPAKPGWLVPSIVTASVICGSGVSGATKVVTNNPRPQPPVDPIGHQVLRPDMTTEIGAVDLGCAPLTADPHRSGRRRHRLAQLVGQHKRRFVLHVEVAGERQHALAFTSLQNTALAIR